MASHAYNKLVHTIYYFIYMYVCIYTMYTALTDSESHGEGVKAASMPSTSAGFASINHNELSSYLSQMTLQMSPPSISTSTLQTSQTSMTIQQIYLLSTNSLLMVQPSTTLAHTLKRHTSLFEPFMTTQHETQSPTGPLVAEISAIMALIILLSLTAFIITLLVLCKKQKWFSIQLEHDYEQQDSLDTTTPFRGSSNQLELIQSSTNETNSSNVQTSFMTTAEAEGVSNTYTELPLVDVEPIYSRVETERTIPRDQEKQPESIANQNTTEFERLSGEVTYAVVDKSKKTKGEKNKVEEESCLEAPPVPAYNPIDPDETDQDKSTTAVGHKNKTETIEQMYAVVNKKQRRMKISEEEEAPPIPPHRGVDMELFGMNKKKVVVK